MLKADSNIIYWVLAIGYVLYSLFFKKKEDQDEGEAPAPPKKQRNKKQEEVLREIFKKLEIPQQEMPTVPPTKTFESQKSTPKKAVFEGESKETFRRKDESLEKAFKGRNRNIKAESLEKIENEITGVRHRPVSTPPMEVEKPITNRFFDLDKESMRKAILYSEILKRPDFW